MFAKYTRIITWKEELLIPAIVHCHSPSVPLYLGLESGCLLWGGENEFYRLSISLLELREKTNILMIRKLYSEPSNRNRFCLDPMNQVEEISRDITHNRAPLWWTACVLCALTLPCVFSHCQCKKRSLCFLNNKTVMVLDILWNFQNCKFIK